MAEDSPQRPLDDEQKRAGEMPGPQESNQDLWKYLTAGTQLAVTVGLFAALGWWVDQKMGWSPWGVLGCGSLGLVIALYQFVRESLTKP